jgi:endo-1,4-beta-xylanase
MQALARMIASTDEEIADISSGMFVQASAQHTPDKRDDQRGLSYETWIVFSDERKTRMFHYFRQKPVFSFALLALCILLLAVFIFRQSIFPQSANNVQANGTLRESAARTGRIFGAAVASSHLTEDQQYANTLDTQFSGVTPENEMKWETTEPARGSFNFAPADTIVSHAQSHNMKIRGHTLVWYSQLAPWINDIATGSELLQVMKNHIANEMGHFKGKIWYWDVVNEAFNDDGSRRSTSNVFQQKIGDSYIEEAFKAARLADPNAKLCYNDYNTDGVNEKSTAIYNMVKDFKARGVPIDCVGFQSHMVVDQVPPDYQENLQRFAALGIDVQITELDIRMSTPGSAADLQAQADNYQRVVKACLAVSRCNDITVWGVTDKYSWIPQYFSGQGAALLFDDNYNKKAACNVVIQTLAAGS